MARKVLSRCSSANDQRVAVSTELVESFLRSKTAKNCSASTIASYRTDMRLFASHVHAIGSSVSADLTKAGLDVTVVDQWPAQVEKLKKDGLIIRMPDIEVRTPIRALHLCELSSEMPEFDIVLLAVKSNDHRWLTEL